MQPRKSRHPPLPSPHTLKLPLIHAHILTSSRKTYQFHHRFQKSTLKLKIRIKKHREWPREKVLRVSFWELVRRWKRSPPPKKPWPGGAGNPSHSQQWSRRGPRDHESHDHRCGSPPSLPTPETWPALSALASPTQDTWKHVLLGSDLGLGHRGKLSSLLLCWAVTLPPVYEQQENLHF